INAIGSFATPFLFTLMYVPTIAMNLSACPTQSWNLWALNYSKVSVKDFMRTGMIWAWIISAINLILVYINFG
ncbi:MAG: citrate transporter, partial [Clostridiales bacterium]|nr:citrate transporter [Clostridiales bacterium]